MTGKKTTRSPILRSRRGAALVEMALVALLLLVLVFGMIDVGLMLRDSLALHQVAREAVRSKGLGSSDSVVNSRAVEWAGKTALDPTKLTVTIGATPGDPQHVSVDLSYHHDIVSGGLFGWPSSINLHASAVMRKE